MKCPKCGGQLERTDDNKYFCPICNSRFSVKSNAKHAQAKSEESQSYENDHSPVASGYSPYDQNSQYAANIGYGQNASQDQSEVADCQASNEISDQIPYLSAPELKPFIPVPQISKAKDIRASARPLVKKNRGYCVLTEILLRLVQIGSLIPLLIFGPLLVGGAIKSSYAGFYVDVANDKCEGSHSTYRGFNNFMPALRLNLLCTLTKLPPLIAIIVIFITWFPFVGYDSSVVKMILGSILIICMIVLLTYLSSLSQFSFFGLNSGVSAKATELLKHSAKLIDKNFGKILILKLSFIGWWILCYWTLGLLLLYVVPYYKTSLTKQYIALLEAKNQTLPSEQEQTPAVA